MLVLPLEREYGNRTRRMASDGIRSNSKGWFDITLPIGQDLRRRRNEKTPTIRSPALPLTHPNLIDRIFKRQENKGNRDLYQAHGTPLRPHAMHVEFRQKRNQLSAKVSPYQLGVSLLNSPSLAAHIKFISILFRGWNSGGAAWPLVPEQHHQGRWPFVSLFPSLPGAQRAGLPGFSARFPSAKPWIRIHASRLLGP